MTFYNQIATTFDSDTYDLYAKSHKISLDQITRNLKSASQILDLCVGTGNFALQLSQHVEIGKFSGIDISQGMIDIAKKKLPFTWRAIVDSASSALDHLAPSSQDLILSHYLYDYIPPNELIPLCYKLLKPGGWLSIITTTKQQYDASFHQEINKSKFLARYLKVRSNIQKATTVDSHQSHIELLKRNGFVVKESDELMVPLRIQNGKEIWNLLYDSGWMVRAVSGYSSLKLNLLKQGVRLLQMPLLNVYPLQFKFHGSLMLVQKKEEK